MRRRRRTARSTSSRSRARARAEQEALLPSEEAQLLVGRNAAGEVTVPIAYRVLYAFLDREGMRKGEAERLTWADLDLGRALIALDENKTDRPRSWVLQPDVHATLSAWHAMREKPKTGAVFVDVDWAQLAAIFRAHCEAVGIDRARLFERKANRLQLRAHDMRAFFITASMYAGRDALWITDRTGHTSLPTLCRYERDVRRWRELGEEPVKASIAIPEIAAALAAARNGSTVPLAAPPLAKTAGDSARFRRRDSNPNKRNQNPLSCH